eukprot:1166320-Amphidinium_carterae.1
MVLLKVVLPPPNAMANVGDNILLKTTAVDCGACWQCDLSWEVKTVKPDTTTVSLCSCSTAECTEPNWH